MNIYIVLLSVWICGSVAANLSLIVCIWKTSTNRRKSNGKSSITSTDILIISLAVNDILLAGVVLPQKIHDLSHTEHAFDCTCKSKKLQMSFCTCIFVKLRSACGFPAP